MGGARYQNNDVIYTVFKKHYCPICGDKLKLDKKTETVNYKSPEAKNYDFNIGKNTHVRGDMKFSYPVFDCLKCNKLFEVDDIKKLEGVDQKIYDKGDDKKINPILIRIGISIIVIIICALFYALGIRKIG